MEMIDGNSEAAPVGRCWSCQLTVNSANCVVIDDQIVSICKGCWNDMPVVSRILVAQKLKSSVGIDEAIEAFQRLAQGEDSGWGRIIGQG